MTCTCGGTTTAAIPDDATNWIANCACGNMLMWSKPLDEHAYDPQLPADGGTLQINIADGSSTGDGLA